MLFIPSLKHKTKREPIQKLPDPKDFHLSLKAYRGTMQPLVHVGEKVLQYQTIAMNTGFAASQLHAPVSGIIKAIITEGNHSSIHLENDFEYQQIPLKSIQPNNLSLADFTDLLQEYGIEGAGGSRFPTQLKYKIQGSSIETLIFNGVECEPYLSADAILMKEQSAALLKTAKLIQDLTKAKQIVFVLEKQNKDVAQWLKTLSAKLHISIEIKLVADKYPQGGELQVIKAVTGLALKKGTIPAKHGILVNNVGTLWAIYKAVFDGIPYTERIVTVSGNKTMTQGNYLVKIGTPVSHILHETQNQFEPQKQSVILGGAMMGKLVSSPQEAVHKGSGGLLLLKKQNSKTFNCIKCGDCASVCPQHLMPLEFVRHQQSKAELTHFHLQDCIACGACAYVCPSEVPLMESIFNGLKSLSP